MNKKERLETTSDCGYDLDYWENVFQIVRRAYSDSLLFNKTGSCSHLHQSPSRRGGGCIMQRVRCSSPALRKASLVKKETAWEESKKMKKEESSGGVIGYRNERYGLLFNSKARHIFR